RMADNAGRTADAQGLRSTGAGVSPVEIISRSRRTAVSGAEFRGRVPTLAWPARPPTTTAVLHRWRPVERPPFARLLRPFRAGRVRSHRIPNDRGDNRARPYWR